MEKLGIPTATVCSDEFYSLGKAEAQCLGVPGLPIAVVPHPVAKLLPDEVAGLARDVVDEICRLWHEDADHLRAEFKEKTAARKTTNAIQVNVRRELYRPQRT